MWSVQNATKLSKIGISKTVSTEIGAALMMNDRYGFSEMLVVATWASYFGKKPTLVIIRSWRSFHSHSLNRGVSAKTNTII